ncbi:hypothetical protein LCGC14_1151350 [marine sediment metagenome]|uniref:Branched-chain amino acid ABC transporter permease n=1 Tax=marine sediment metagenome TaxID=412755 RepID=A0A0F9M0A2_9ZZZZ|nr:branched-chain amino acid ABC transporter permease [Desulfobacterales bacterium]
MVRNPKVVINIVVVISLIVMPLVLPIQFVYWGMISYLGAIIALAFNVSYGYCRLFNFALSGFSMLGGYCTAIMIDKLNVPFIVALPISIIFSILFARVLGTLLLRLRHWLFGLASLCFSMIISISVEQLLVPLTNGEDGIQLPALVVFGHTMGELFYYYLLFAVTVFCYYISHIVWVSHIGRAMRAIGSNETVAISVGTDVPNYLNLGFLISAAFASLVGAIWVQASSWASPKFFDLGFNIDGFTAAIVGGVGAPLGALVGGVIFFILPQIFIAFEKYHILFQGLVLVSILRFLPLGIVGTLQSKYRR